MSSSSLLNLHFSYCKQLSSRLYCLYIVCSAGEPFTQEEMEEMISAAVDPDKNIVPYKDYVSMMVVDY